MDINIDRGPEESSRVQKQPSSTTNGKIKPFSFSRDVLESIKGDRNRIINLAPNRPVLIRSEMEVARILQEAIQNIPKQMELIKNLAPKTVELIKKHLKNLKGSEEIKQLYQLLARTFPIAASYLTHVSAKEKGTQLNDTLVSILGELVENLEKANTLPKEILQLLKQKPQEHLNTLTQQLIKQKDLMNELATLITSKTTKGKEKLIEQLIEAKLLPGSVKGVETLTPEIFQEATLSLKGKALLDQVLSIVQTLHTVHTFPTKDQSEVMMLMMASTTIRSQGLLGPQLTQLNQNLTNQTIHLSEKLGLFVPQGERSVAAKNYLSGVFDQFLVGGILMGRALSIGMDGKKIDLNDQNQISHLRLQNTQEVKIFDQIPFNFLAFFVPYEDLTDDSSEVLKEAKNTLMKLVRNLLKLVFALLAILSGGSQLGKEGIHLMLKENTDFLKQTLDDIFFGMKKLNELYGVDVKYPLAHGEEAKGALLSQDFPLFWEHIFKVLASEGDLKDFLQETKDADPLYKAIHALVGTQDVEASSINLRSSG